MRNFCELSTVARRARLHSQAAKQSVFCTLRFTDVRKLFSEFTFVNLAPFPHTYSSTSVHPPRALAKATHLSFVHCVGQSAGLRGAICATLTVWPALRPFPSGRWVRGSMTWHAASRWTRQRWARDSARVAQLFMLSTSWTTEKRPLTCFWTRHHEPVVLLAQNARAPLFVDLVLRQFSKDVLLATSSAVTCGRVGGSVSLQPLAHVQHAVHAIVLNSDRLGLRLAMLGVVGHGVLPAVPSAWQSHLQLSPV